MQTKTLSDKIKVNLYLFAAQQKLFGSKFTTFNGQFLAVSPSISWFYRVSLGLVNIITVFLSLSFTLSLSKFLILFFLTWDFIFINAHLFINRSINFTPLPNSVVRFNFNQ